MADISEEIQAFEDAVYGEDVRGAIIDLANKLNDDLEDALEHEFVEVDDTLSISGQGADAAVTGAALNSKADASATAAALNNKADASTTTTALNSKANISNPTFTGKMVSGSGCTASGDYSVAIGDRCVASGDHSVALGGRCTASNSSCVSLGFFCSASGLYSTAIGHNASATGQDSVSIGRMTEARGEFSYAEGVGAVAIGSNTHAEGYNTFASSDYQHVQGKCNVKDEHNVYAHIVGNGTVGAESNAHTIDWSGNAWFAGEIRVGGTDYAGGSKLIPLPAFSSSDSGKILGIDSNGNLAWVTP